MSKNHNKEEQTKAQQAAQQEQTKATEHDQQSSSKAQAAEPNEDSDKKAEQKPEAKHEETAEEKVARLEEEVKKQKNQYLLLMAEFDNYRKRTLKDKQELIKNGCAKAMEDILPVIDDFDRAIEQISKTDNLDAMKQGIDLIYTKFKKYLEKNNVKEIESTGHDFDTDVHEAVTTFPAPDESQKGKVIDTVLKGYTLNDKVLRHAKVVVGK